MKFFEDLGLRIDDAWKRLDYDPSVFTGLAVAHLQERPPSEHVDPMEILDWALTARAMPGGEFDTKFGQPPVRVFRSLHFYIEVLFWLDSTTSIHQHSFAGAFHVLAGSSIQSLYSFEATKRLGARLLLGELAMSHLELLEKGAVRPIHAGRATTHALFHLDHPSVSVVVRTPGLNVVEPQYSYSRAGIAYDAHFPSESAFLKSQTLHLLRSTKHPSFLERVRSVAQAADAYEAFFVLTSLTGGMVPPDEANRILDAALPAHAELVERLRRMAAYERREMNIILRRNDITNPEHRFLMALLLNVASRRELLRVVGERFPGTPAVDKVVGWVEELANEKSQRSQTSVGAHEEAGSNVLGVELDETSLAVLRHLLGGATNDQVLSRLREEFDEVDEQRDDVFELCDAFRGSLLFGQILS